MHLFSFLCRIIRIILSGQPAVFPPDSLDIVLHCDILLLSYDKDYDGDGDDEEEEEDDDDITDE